MFFMVQGYFMSSGASDWAQSTWKKIKKTYVPYLYWAVAYGIFFWFTAGKTFTFMDIIYGKTALHLYYMFYYMVFAIICPLLYFLPRAIRVSTLWIMLFSNIAMNIILEISKTYHVTIFSWSGPNIIKWWGFIAIGMLLAEYPRAIEYIKNHPRQMAAAAFAVFFIGLAEPYLAGTTGYLFNKGALFPLSVCLTLLLAIYYSTPNPLGEKFLSYVGSRTLGIYLGHFFLVDFLRIQLIPGDRALVAVIILFTCLAVKEIKDRAKLKLFSANSVLKTRGFEG